MLLPPLRALLTLSALAAGALAPRAVDAQGVSPASGPVAGYRILGPLRGYHAETNSTDSTLDPWQSLHIPHASASALGMVEASDGIEPYLMAAGTWWAHVMILQRPSRY